MSAWHCAFLFPGVDQHLAPSNGVCVSSCYSLVFDRKICLKIKIDVHDYLKYEIVSHFHTEDEPIEEIQQLLDSILNLQ